MRVLDAEEIEWDVGQDNIAYKSAFLRGANVQFKQDIKDFLEELDGLSKDFAPLCAELHYLKKRLKQIVNSDDCKRLEDGQCELGFQVCALTMYHTNCKNRTAEQLGER